MDPALPILHSFLTRVRKGRALEKVVSADGMYASSFCQAVGEDL